MNKIFKRTAGIATALLLTVATSAVAFTSSASAIAYTPDSTGLSQPGFNVFTGVPGYGDESSFVTGRVSGSSAAFADPVNDPCTAGTQYSVRVYVHNGANQTLNNNGSGPGVAHNTKVKVAVPATTAGNIRGTISASNAASVSDTLTINCANGKTMTMSYVAGSAIQQKMNGATAPLSDSIVTTGAPIGTQSPNGEMWGCFDQRVLVYLKVEVKEAPPTPTVTATCDLFRVTASSDRKVTVSQFKYTANNANYKNAVISWGDGSNSTVTNANSVIGTTHQFKAEGTYKIIATVTFTSANGDLVRTSVNCAQQVTFKDNQPPEIVTPSTPTGSEGVGELANTGAGSVAGIIVAAVVAGVVAFRVYLGRRLSRQ